MTDTPTTDPTDFDLNEYERRMARIHATALQEAASEIGYVDWRGNTIADPEHCRALSAFANILAGEYRRIANTGKAGL